MTVPCRRGLAVSCSSRVGSSKRSPGVTKIGPPEVLISGAAGWEPTKHAPRRSYITVIRDAGSACDANFRPFMSQGDVVDADEAAAMFPDVDLSSGELVEKAVS